MDVGCGWAGVGRYEGGWEIVLANLAWGISMAFPVSSFGT